MFNIECTVVCSAMYTVIRHLVCNVICYVVGNVVCNVLYNVACDVVCNVVCNTVPPVEVTWAGITKESRASEDTHLGAANQSGAVQYSALGL